MKRLALFAAALLALSQAGHAGEARLTWTAPTLNTDGTPYDDLTSYDILYGCQQSGQYDSLEVLQDPLATEYTVTGLPDGQTCYFAMRSYNSLGVASGLSNEAQKSLVDPPGVVRNLSVTWQESPVMATPSYKGVTKLNASGGNGSSSTVTIPSGATVGVIMLNYWDTGSGNIASVTVDGQSATQHIDVPRSGDNSGQWLGTVTGFATGTNKTISWTWDTDQAISEGGYLYITWWGDVDTTTPLDASGADRNTLSSAVQVASLSTADTDNVVVTFVQRFISGAGAPEMTADGSPTITSVFNDDDVNSERVDVDYFTRTQATHTIDMTNEYYSSIIAAVLNPATAGDTNVAANTEALTLTTQQASVAHDVDVAANTEALTLTTQPAAVSLDVDIAANTEGLTLTTQPATITYDVNVLAGTEALTLTTFPASLGGDVNISANLEQLTLTTQPATVSHDINVSANLEQLTLTALQASIANDVDVQANVEQLTLTTQQASIDFVGDTDVAAQTAALFLTTYQAQVDGSRLSADTPTGGWLNEYNAYQQRKRDQERRRREIMQAVRELDGVDGEIARYLHEDEVRAERDAQQAEFRRILDAEISKAELEKAGILNERVNRAYDRAMKKATFSAVEALEREIQDAIEEEDFAFLVLALN